MDHLKIIEDCNNKDSMKEKLDTLSKINHDEEAVMYILVNNDLKMEKGKIAGQCCHSSCRVTRIIENMDKYPGAYDKWINNFEPKIILKATENDLNYCIQNYSDVSKDIWCIYTKDIERTLIKKNSLNTVAF